MGTFSTMQDKGNGRARTGGLRDPPGHWDLSDFMNTSKSGGYGGLDSCSFVNDLVNSVFLLDIPLRIYIDILPGGLVDINGETYDVDESLINDSDHGWEVEMEIKDIFYEFLKRKVPFIHKSCGYQIFEIYPIYPRG